MAREDGSPGRPRYPAWRLGVGLASCQSDTTSSPCRPTSLLARSSMSPSIFTTLGWLRLAFECGSSRPLLPEAPPHDGMDSRKERATPGRAGPNRNATCAANSTAQDGSASKRRNSVSTEMSAASLMAFASGGGARPARSPSRRATASLTEQRAASSRVERHQAQEHAKCDSGEGDSSRRQPERAARDHHQRAHQRGTRRCPRAARSAPAPPGHPAPCRRRCR